jgi:molybdopterin-guanine dinucleotide biosynthesis protein A
MKYPAEDLFVIACDMPLMNIEVLEDLLGYFNKEPGYEGYVYLNDGEPEPLCGLYKSAGLSKILSKYDKGNLSKHSMKSMLDRLMMFRIPLPEPWKIYFKNINAHADLNGM